MPQASGQRYVNSIASEVHNSAALAAAQLVIPSALDAAPESTASSVTSLAKHSALSASAGGAEAASAAAAAANAARIRREGNMIDRGARVRRSAQK